MAKKLYVGNLSYDTKEDGLKALFAKAGQVESCQIITDKYSGRSKGFGFVEMASDEEAAKAVEMLNNSELDGRNITVAEARPMADRPAGGGFNRGGGFRDRGDRGGFNRNRDSRSNDRW
ncbi:MAG: RNA-binding protein [Patescibacteria group bacterium]|nr:RNA-binding protein [Patescibacteria group bacterium]